MRLGYPALLLALCACNTPSPGFYGAMAVTREVEGSRFQIRVQEDMAEVIRTSPEFPARYGPISERAQKAVFLETGCIPEWVSGDPAMMVMGLSCDGRPAPSQPKRRTISCEIYDAHWSDRLGGSAALDCDAY